MLKGSWEPVLSHIPFLILNNFNNFCNTQIVLWDPLYSCWPNVNNITRVWFHHCIHSTECGPVFKLLIKTKYLCEILRVCWKHICLGVTLYLFGILIHIFCLTEWKWLLLVTRVDATNLFHKNGDTQHCQPEPGYVNCGDIYFKCPPCIFCVLCSTYFSQIKRCISWGYRFCQLNFWDFPTVTSM